MHRPQANPVERKHRDLKSILAIAVGRDHTEWDENLPATRFAMNTCITQATGFSPSFLVFASNSGTPQDINCDTRPIAPPDNVGVEIAPYLEKLQNLLRCARETLALEQDRLKEIVEAHNREMLSFNPGDRVLVSTFFPSNASVSLTSKLYPKRDGPFLINRQCSPTSYEVAAVDQPEVVLGKYHVSDLTLFRESEEEATPVSPIRLLRRRGRPKKIRPQSIHHPPEVPPLATTRRSSRTFASKLSTPEL